MRSGRMKGFAFTLEALLSLLALASLALLLGQAAPSPADYASLRAVLAAGDAAEVLVQNPAAHAELEALSLGPSPALERRLERMARGLGVCLEVRAGRGVARAGCDRELAVRARGARALWTVSGFLEFEVAGGA